MSPLYEHVCNLAVTCGVGEEVSEEGECVPCQVGYYQPHSVGVQCEKCPEGTTTDEEGATTEQQCTGTVELWK